MIQSISFLSFYFFILYINIYKISLEYQYFTDITVINTIKRYISYLNNLSHLACKENYWLICSCFSIASGYEIFERYRVIDKDIFYGEMISEGFVGIFKWVKWALWMEVIILFVVGRTRMVSLHFNFLSFQSFHYIVEEWEQEGSSERERACGKWAKKKFPSKKGT